MKTRVALQMYIHVYENMKKTHTHVKTWNRKPRRIAMNVAKNVAKCHPHPLILKKP